MLTDKQIKVLKYIKKRATPPTIREIALQTMIEKNTCYALLKRLSRLGCVESFLKKDPDRKYIVAERYYRFITMEVKETKAKPKPPSAQKFAKTRITMPINTYHNPFNLTGKP
jgi:Fe2+ or Zn2+ uptake regulation protein